MSDDGDDVLDRFERRFDDSADQTGRGDRNGVQQPDRSDATDATDATDSPDGPYGTYSTPGGVGFDDVDASSVRDAADREFYLPEPLLDELDLAFDELNLRYRQRHAHGLNKHPHWYCRVLIAGLDAIGDVSDRDLDELEDELGLPGGED